MFQSENITNSSNEGERMETLLRGYLERSNEIRHLSIPPRREGMSADQFYELFQSNFVQIRKLLQENKEFLNQQVYPCLEHPQDLSREQARQLMGFSDELADTGTLETVDTRLALTLVDALEQYYRIQYEAGGDRADLINRIHCIYRQLILCYNVALIYERGTLTLELSRPYRDRILECARMGREYIENQDIFKELPMDAQEDLVETQLFKATGYERSFYSEELVRAQVETYQDCIRLFSRPELKSSSPGIDWEYYIFSAQNFLCLVHDFLFWEKVPKDILDSLNEAADQEIAYIEKHPDNRRSTMEAAVSSKFVISFYRGERSFADAMNKYKDWYATRDPKAYNKTNMDANLLAVASAMGLCKKNPKHLDSERDYLKGALENVFHYIDGPLDDGTYETLQRYISYLLDEFIELEGGVTFREFYENLLVTTQPSLYVHSRMVALISQCILEAAFLNDPEMLEGVLGFENREDILEHRGEIEHFLYECALLHDAGKIYFSDTINLYNRRLFPEEFRLIQFHTLSGYQLLSGYDSTRAYAEGALYHHLWFNEQAGYPGGHPYENTSNGILYQIITCADCTDAATDTLCRAYSQGKTLEELLAELRSGAGTQYNPRVVALFDHANLREQVDALIQKERRTIYYQAFFRHRNIYRK